MAIELLSADMTGCIYVRPILKSYVTVKQVQNVQFFTLGLLIRMQNISRVFIVPNQVQRHTGLGLHGNTSHVMQGRTQDFISGGGLRLIGPSLALPPFPSSPSPPLPLFFHPSPTLPLEVGPFNLARGSGGAL